MSSTVLFDLPGPRARRRQLIGTVAGGLVVAVLVGLALWQLGKNEQLDPNRWAILFDPAAGVPQALAEALVNTLQVAAVGMIAATVLGALLAVGRLSDHRWVRVPVTVVIEFFRAVPLLVLIFSCLLFLPTVGVPMTAFRALALGLTLYNMAVLAEIFRAGILSVDRGQWEAARAIGFGHLGQMRHVVLPQALRRMTPALVSQLITLTKDTSLASVIGVNELARRAGIVYNTYFNPVETLLVMAGIYFTLCANLSALSRRLEPRDAASQPVTVVVGE